MKSFTGIVLLSTASLAQACVTAHTFFNSCVYDIANDINSVQIQVWDNGNEVCNGADGDPSGSQDTWYHLDCGNGAFVDVQGYGSRLNYTSADGYFVSLSSTDSNPVMGYTCGQTDHTIEGGTEAENVFADEYCGNCNTAQLCDYKSYCPDFDASCH